MRSRASDSKPPDAFIQEVTLALDEKQSNPVCTVWTSQLHPPSNSACPILAPVTFVPVSHLNPHPTRVLLFPQASWPPMSPSHAVRMEKLAGGGGEGSRCSTSVLSTVSMHICYMNIN